ncbi:hypothetical protein [Salmonella phage SSBI34]|nr:hypothetical protein [Salmonella phage SSBI34]
MTAFEAFLIVYLWGVVLSLALFFYVMRDAAKKVKWLMNKGTRHRVSRRSLVAMIVRVACICIIPVAILKSLTIINF